MYYIYIMPPKKKKTFVVKKPNVDKKEIVRFQLNEKTGKMEKEKKRKIKVTNIEPSQQEIEDPGIQMFDRIIRNYERWTEDMKPGVKRYIEEKKGEKFDELIFYQSRIPTSAKTIKLQIEREEKERKKRKPIKDRPPIKLTTFN